MYAPIKYKNTGLNNLIRDSLNTKPAKLTVELGEVKVNAHLNKETCLDGL